MKKIFSGIFALAMIGMMISPVSADNTTVNYTEASDYTINIPATVTIEKNSIKEFKITATKMNTNPEQKVVVKATGGVTNGKVQHPQSLSQ